MTMALLSMAKKWNFMPVTQRGKTDFCALPVRVDVIFEHQYVSILSLYFSIFFMFAFFFTLTLCLSVCVNSEFKLGGKHFYSVIHLDGLILFSAFL